MNASPATGTPWDPAGYYELRLDTNEDYVEDITWRFTFPVDSAGTQHVQVAELTGKEATSRLAKGRIITPPHARVGEVLCLDRGIKIFAGKRRDPFFNYIPFPLAVTAALANGTFPDLKSLFPPHDSFLNQSVRSVLVEAPVEITGFGRLNYWATTAVYDQGHSAWFQVQRAGGPNTTTFWDFVHGSAQININATFDQGLHGRPTALAYGAWVADTLLPNVIPFIPGTNALWDPWQGSHNGKGLREDAFDNVTKMVLNQDFVSGLTQPSPLLDYFPYVSPPPES